MHTRTALAVIVPTLVALATSSTAFAEDPAGAVARRLDPPAQHVVHVDWATFGLANGVSVNYEHHFDDHFSVRVGYGASFVFMMLSPSKAAHGPLAMATLLVGDDSNLELSAGVSLIASSEAPLSGAKLGGDWYVSPDVFVGYRYQPERGGLMVRAGLGVHSGFATVFTLGVGHAF